MNVTVRIVQDTEPPNPRQDWDCNVGVMACWYSRYELGDVQPKESPESWLKENAPEGSVVLPLFLYDHSGITMKTSAFSCGWDSGQVGYIVATPEKIREVYNEINSTKFITEALEQEVKTYDQYLRGDVWGYIVENKCDSCEQTTGCEESCFGFFGDDLEGMKCNLDEKYHKLLEEAWENRYG